jgi:hypothetical protein
MRHVETTPGVVEEGIKENDGGGELKNDML